MGIHSCKGCLHYILAEKMAEASKSAPMEVEENGLQNGGSSVPCKLFHVFIIFGSYSISSMGLDYSTNLL